MEGIDGGELAEPASPPRLLTGAAKPEMIHIAGSTQDPCLCGSSYSATPCTGCYCWTASRHHLLQLFFLPFLCSLERNQGDGVNKSHSQPTKPPPCSPGKCSLQTHRLCRDMAVGLGGTRANHGDRCWGESCAEPGEGQGDGCWVILPELLEDEGTCPVLMLLQMSTFWPCVDVFTQYVFRNAGLGCLSRSGACAQCLVMGKQQRAHTRKHEKVSCHSHRATSLLQGHSSTSRCNAGLSLLPTVTDAWCIVHKEGDIGSDAASRCCQHACEQ